MYATPTPTVLDNPVVYTSATRQKARARHFFQEGRDLFQTKSPKLEVATSLATISSTRQKAALREQQALIAQQDTDFIHELFATDLPYDAVTAILDYVLD